MSAFLHGDENFNIVLQRIGRQHLVSYQATNKGITVSSCLFDGTSKSAALCDGKHYWVWLFWGTHDEITLINNHVLNTAGRTPHAGGWNKAQVRYSLYIVHALCTQHMSVFCLAKKNTNCSVLVKTGH